MLRNEPRAMKGRPTDILPTRRIERDRRIGLASDEIVDGALRLGALGLLALAGHGGEAKR